jgi:hypothetical protein
MNTRPDHDPGLLSFDTTPSRRRMRFDHVPTGQREGIPLPRPDVAGGLGCKFPVVLTAAILTKSARFEQPVSSR